MNARTKNLKIFSNIKTIILFLGLILQTWNTTCFAQDTLVMKNGTEVICKVLEISSTEVSFKKTNNMDGPTYIEKKWDVSKIKYSNGSSELVNIEKPLTTYERAKPILNRRKYPQLEQKRGKYIYGAETISVREMQSILLDLNNPQINDEIKSAKKWRKKALIAFPCTVIIPLGALVFIGGALFEDNIAMTTGMGMAVLGIAFPVTGLVATHISRNHNREARILYNQNYNY